MLRMLLPHGLVRASQVAARLQALGLPRSRAWQRACDPDTPVRLSRAGLELLPRGALADPECVIDAGANIGDWSADLLRFCTPRRHLCIEPHPALAASLRQRFAAHAAVQVVECALGSATGEVRLNTAANPLLHSLRLPAAGMAGRFPADFRVDGELAVRMRTLDELARDLPRVSLLKLDLQGYEREALAGAGDTLRRTDAVLTEVNFVPHYEGEADFAELHGIFVAAGFRLANYAPPSGGDERCALFANFLYLRAAG